MAQQGQARQAKLTLGVFLGLYLVAVVPVLTAPIPPLFDYPNHLGRMAILAAAGNDPTLNRYYAVRWSLLPNLGMDAMVPVLARFMPLVIAGQVFLLMVLGLLAAGPVLLFRGFWGYWSPWPCAGFLLLYSRVFLWGFVNYLAGIGLAMAAMALWLFLGHRSWLVRGMAGAGAVMVVFLCHLEAFGVLVLALLGLDGPHIMRDIAARAWSSAAARTAGLALALLPAAVVFFVLWQPHAGAAMTAPRLDRKLDLLFSVFDNYSRPFDVVCFVAVVVAAIVGLIKRKLVLAPGAGPVLGMIGLVYLLLPSTLFTGAGADHRLPLALFLILAAATNPSGLTRRAMTILACSGVILFGVRMAAIEAVWSRDADIYRGDLAILSMLKPGARLAVAAPAKLVEVIRAPLYHFPVLAVVLRDAFVPTLFAYDTQQPVALREPWRSIAAQSDPNRIWLGFTGTDLNASLIRQFVFTHYDAVVFPGGPAPNQIDTHCLRPLGASNGFWLYTIVVQPKGC